MIHCSELRLAHSGRRKVMVPFSKHRIHIITVTGPDWGPDCPSQVRSVGGVRVGLFLERPHTWDPWSSLLQFLRRASLRKARRKDGWGTSLDPGGSLTSPSTRGDQQHPRGLGITQCKGRTVLLKTNLKLSSTFILRGPFFELRHSLGSK